MKSMKPFDPTAPRPRPFIERIPLVGHVIRAIKRTFGTNDGQIQVVYVDCGRIEKKRPVRFHRFTGDIATIYEWKFTFFWIEFRKNGVLE